jgi:RsmE family RNA methyltransferase
MNVLLLEPEEIDAGTTRARIGGRRLRYVRDVHRAAAGEALRVGLIGGALGSGTIVRLDDEVLELDVVFDEPAPAPLPLTVLLALPRPKSLKRLLQALAAMGVKEIFLINTWRVEKSYWHSPLLEPAALREQLLLGLEQARDTRLPAVHLRRRFKPFVEDEVPRLAAGTTALVAHPDGADPCPRTVAGQVTLAVGPEGGFIAYEVELLRRQGFAPVTLGPRRLRAEQALPALLGRLF